MGSTEDRQISARKFIDHCISKFGWSDLSKDVVMDVGCGRDGFCGKSLLKKFSKVGAIIFTDMQKEVASQFKQNSEMGTHVDVMDIEKRNSIRNYEGKMTKVVSTHVFHLLKEKEEAFRNVYHLLKPGGEAAVLFNVEALVYDWLMEMLKNPRWKRFFRGCHAEEFYNREHGAAHYKEMLEKIGFRVVECSEKKREILSNSNETCKEALYKLCGLVFRVPPKLFEEFKEESYQVLLQLSERDEQEKEFSMWTELYLLLVKPAEVPGSQ